MVAGFYDAYARVTLGKAKGETPPPLDLTEFGWNTDPNASPHNASFGDAAWNIDQFYSELGTRGCVQASYLYKWQDSPSDPSGNEEFSLYDQNGHPRGPMVSAYEKAGAWLRCSAGSAYGKRFGKEVTGPGEGHATIHP